MKCLDSTEQLDEYLKHFCEKLNTMNPEALALLKKVFWEGTDHWDQLLLEERAEMSGRLVLSKFCEGNHQRIFKIIETLSLSLAML